MTAALCSALRHEEIHMAVENKEKLINQQDALRYLTDYFYLRDDISLSKFLEEMERNIIILTLIKFEGHQKRAAEFLGIKYTTFNEKVKKYKIQFTKELYIKNLGFNPEF